MLAFVAHVPLQATRSFSPLLSRPTKSSHVPRRVRVSLRMSTPSPSSEETPQEVPFEIRGFSLANVFLGAGALITIYSFSSYFNSNGTASATSLGFVYGVPILLVGCALKYAELEPIRIKSFDGAKEAREAKATETQKKIYSDITRHRYGDEAHLSAAMAALGLQPRGEPCPELLEGEERAVNGEYQLRLLFYSVATPWKVWQGKTEKYERFFGPGVIAEVEKVDTEKRLVALTLTTGVRSKQDEGIEKGVEAAVGGDSEA